MSVPVLAVGERCHVPGYEKTQQRRAEWLWDANPLKCVMKFPAFRGDGATAARARWLLPGAVFVNLLPPAAECGVWDACLAKHIAPLVHRWARDNGWKVALFGRRVVDAFLGGNAGLGERKTYDGVDYLTLPHPSGRCRLWNDPADAARYVCMGEEFCR